MSRLFVFISVHSHKFFVGVPKLNYYACCPTWVFFHSKRAFLLSLQAKYSFNSPQQHHSQIYPLGVDRENRNASAGSLVRFTRFKRRKVLFLEQRGRAFQKCLVHVSEERFSWPSPPTRLAPLENKFGIIVVVIVVITINHHCSNSIPCLKRLASWVTPGVFGGKGNNQRNKNIQLVCGCPSCSHTCAQHHLRIVCLLTKIFNRTFPLLWKDIYGFIPSVPEREDISLPRALALTGGTNEPAQQLGDSANTLHRRRTVLHSMLLFGKATTNYGVRWPWRKWSRLILLSRPCAWRVCHPICHQATLAGVAACFVRWRFNAEGLHQPSAFLHSPPWGTTSLGEKILHLAPD